MKKIFFLISSCSFFLQAEQFDRETFLQINQARVARQSLFEKQLFYSLNGNTDIEVKKMQKTMPGEEEKYFSLSNVALILEKDITPQFFTRLTPSYYDSNRGQGDPDQNSQIVMIDDAFVTYIPTRSYPLFVELGRMYLPFGLYDRYPLRPSFTQMIAESRSEGLQIGFANWHHFSLTAYLAQGYVTPKDGNIQSELNYGGNFLYQNQFGPHFSMLFGVQYMRNMLNTNAMVEGGNYYKSSGTKRVNFYTQVMDGVCTELELTAHINEEQKIGLTAQFLSAIRRSDDIARLRTSPTDSSSGLRGARPRTFDGGLYYKDVWGNKPIKIEGTYDVSQELGGLYVYCDHDFCHPFAKRKFTVSATVSPYPFMSLQFLWGHNTLYDVEEGDNGRYGDDAVVRFGLEF